MSLVPAQTPDMKLGDDKSGGLMCSTSDRMYVFTSNSKDHPSSAFLQYDHTTSRLADYIPSSLRLLAPEARMG